MPAFVPDAARFPLNLNSFCQPPSTCRRPRSLQHIRLRHSTIFQTPAAVFLPPEGPPPPPDDTEDPPERLEQELPNRLSGIDRLLAETIPEYTTWKDANARRSLATFRSSRAYLGADELNESMRPSHLQRHRHVLAPDEAFGAIFCWDVVVANSRELERLSWAAVAEEAGLPVPDLDDIVRAEDMAPEAAVSRVFYWSQDWGEVKQHVFRKNELYEKLREQFQYEKTSGLEQWLLLLERYGVKCVLCAARPRASIEVIVKALGLDRFFSKNEIISSDDEFESLEQMFLIAAVKSERPPGKCVVFTDKPSGITAGHEISSKVVAFIGAHPAYEVKTADQTVRDFGGLVVYNIRRLFSEEGSERMDPMTEIETEIM